MGSFDSCSINRSFITAISALLTICGIPAEGGTVEASRLFFVSNGQIGQINADGSGEHFLELDVPLQETWNAVSFLSDGRRVILFSMEKRRDGPGKPFQDYYHQTPTHLWIYDLESGKLTEIATQDRMAVFYSLQLLLPSEDRMLVQVLKKASESGTIFNMKLDGGDAREFMRKEEGFPYDFEASPDGSQVAFHVAGPRPHLYRVMVSGFEGGGKTVLADQRGHLYFGPTWSPDGDWLAYLDCISADDPGHDWADVCIGRPDGSFHKVLTEGQVHWFAATYGSPEKRGGGSNVLDWTRDGRIVFSRKLPGSKVAWEYQPDRPDTDHYNRDFKPELAGGGTQICLLDPDTGEVTELTPAKDHQWDFRGVVSPDGSKIAFCRAATGEMPGLWVMNLDGSEARMITKGIDGFGTDHPRWLPEGK
jgi:TolB protein